jgi:transposase
MKKKIDEAQLIEAVTRYFHGEKMKDIAKDLEVSSSCISELRFKLQRILHQRIFKVVSLALQSGLSIEEVIDSVNRGIFLATERPFEKARIEALCVENEDKQENFL